MGKTKRWDRQRFIHTAVGAVILPLGAAATLLWPLAGGAYAATAPRAPRMSLPAAGQPGGDIPDSAVYLRYTGRGFSVEYVEGWLQTAAAHGVTFSDKDSAVIVDLRPRLGGDLSAYVQRIDLSRLAHTPGFRREGLTRDSIGGYHALRLTYRGQSEPDAVTGKTVALQVDRYYVQGPHALAVMTLATPLGVDNADGFRRIAHSFRFR
ncbi:MAG: hypothetical protein M3Y74_21940 [Chloroflexota bacterium]|nr:hypothetical protein [Chloroflexota bacterium]